MPMTPPCKSVKTAAELRDAARSALGGEVMLTDFAPLLPMRWPIDGTGVVYWTYRSEALPTGMVRYRIRGPTVEIMFASLTTPPVARHLGIDRVLGEEGFFDRPAGEESRLERAEQALVDLVAGCREPDAARVDLRPYVDWLGAHPVMGKDLEMRAPAFLAWLRRSAAP